MNPVYKPLEGERIFLSGPVTIKDYDEACLDFSKAKQTLIDLGADYVWVPTENITPDADHEPAMFASLRELTADSLRHKPFYTSFFLMPGWQESEGCNVEHDVAKAIGIPIHHLIMGAQEYHYE